jgi:threonine dehydrogenase-like Zn-dependent dehydrogenase
MAEPSAHGLRLRFGASVFNHRLLRTFGGPLPRLTDGWMPWLAYGPMPAPEPRSPDWVRLRPVLSGVCGTDLGLLTGHASTILSPFASFPAVLGHEVLARTEDGRRVALDPVITCSMRGLSPCRWCAAGLPGLCLRAAEGDLAPGPMIGFCRDLAGGWSDAMVAHASQLHPVPDPVHDDEAVLVEPLSVAMHAVLQQPPERGERVLVIGGGTMGLCTLAALWLTAAEADVTVQARHPVQAGLAERMGTTRVIRDVGVAGAVRAAEQVAGASRYRSLLGQPVLSGGFDHVYDCVGSRRSLEASLRVAAPRGRVVLVGGPALVSGLDWTLAWTRELRIVGTYVYGREPSLPGAPHTMDHVLSLLERRPGLPLGELVTHRFPLARWRRAMSAALGRGRSGAIKVVFEAGS